MNDIKIERLELTDTAILGYQVIDNKDVVILTIPYAVDRFFDTCNITITKEALCDVIYLLNKNFNV